MLRAVTWRFWASVAALVGGYCLLGAFYDQNARVTQDVNDAAWLALFFAPLAVLAVTTATQRWWRNDVGVNLILSIAGLMPMAGIFCWVFFRDHGSITTSAMAWAFIGTPLWTAGWLLFRAFIYLRIGRDKRLLRGAPPAGQDT